MTTVLVTGSQERVDEMVAALGSAGVQVLRANDLDALQAVVAGLGSEQVDAYVQLPVTIASEATTAVGRVRDLLTRGLIARFDAAEVALRAVRDGGTAILVAGNSPGERDLADDERARSALLRVLSHTILADNGGRRIRSVVLPSGSGAEAVVDTVRDGEGAARERVIADFVDRDAELDYAEWRLALLSLAGNES